MRASLTDTVPSAVQLRAALWVMTVDGATDGPVLLTFPQRVLCPQLRPGDIVVLDNLRAHHVTGVAEALAGASLRYLPPYSPDYNPIEFAWSKVKARLQTQAARTRLRLYRALGSALQMIAPQDARAWFRHDGYGSH
jgi:transposase